MLERAIAKDHLSVCHTCEPRLHGSKYVEMSLALYDRMLTVVSSHQICKLEFRDSIC